jgi:polar amino acid transport system substrate-binding protein
MFYRSSGIFSPSINAVSAQPRNFLTMLNESRSRRTLALFAVVLLGVTTSCSGRTITICAKPDLPFAYQTSPTDLKWTGFSIEVFKYCISEGFVHDENCTSLPCPAASRYDDYDIYSGSKDFKSNDDGFACVNDGNGDVYVSAPTMTYSRETIVDFTFPFFKTGLGVAVTVDNDPSKQTAAFFNTLFSPGTLSFLFSLISVLWAVASLVWCLEMVGSEEIRLRSIKFFDSSPIFGMIEALTWAFFTLVTPRSYKPPNHPISKKLGSMLSFLTVVFAATITSLITSAMLAQPDIKINVVEDIGNKKLVKMVARITDKSISQIFIDAQGWTNTKDYASLDLALAALKRGEVNAVVYDKPMLLYAQKVQAQAVQAGDEALSKTNLMLSTLPLQFEPQEYGFVLPETSQGFVKESLGKCVLSFVKDRYESTRKKYLTAATADQAEQGPPPGGVILNICLLIIPTIIAYFVVKKLRKADSEKDFEAEVEAMKMKRLGMVNDNDIFEMICTVMEGQRDIMDLVYRTATKEETYKGKSLTMKDIHVRQQRLTKSKERILNLRQKENSQYEAERESVAEKIGTLIHSVKNEHAALRVAWVDIKDKITFDSEHDKEELTAFIEKAMRYQHILDMKSRKSHAMKSAYKIWESVKGPLKDEFQKKEGDANDHFMDNMDGNIHAIDTFFDVLRNGHALAEDRWKKVWVYTQEQHQSGNDDSWIAELNGIEVTV